MVEREDAGGRHSGFNQGDDMPLTIDVFARIAIVFRTDLKR